MRVPIQKFIDHRWIQEATPTLNSGWVTFYDKDNMILSRYVTIQEKGLYFNIQDLQFVPSTNPILSGIHQVSVDATTSPDMILGIYSSDDLTLRTSTPRSDDVRCHDFDPPLHVEHLVSQLQPRSFHFSCEFDMH